MTDYSIIVVAFISPIASASYPKYSGSELLKQPEPKCGTFNTASCCEESKLWDNECHDCDRGFFWDDMCHSEPGTLNYSVSTNPNPRSEQPDIIEYAEWPEQTEYTGQLENPIHTEQSDKTEYAEQIEYTEYTQQPDKTKYTQLAEYNEYTVQPEHTEYTEKTKKTKYIEQPEKTEYTEQPEYTKVTEQSKKTEYSQQPEQTENNEQPKQPVRLKEPSQEYCKSKGLLGLKHNLNFDKLSDSIPNLDQNHIENPELLDSNLNLDHDLKNKKPNNARPEYEHCQKSGLIDLGLNLNFGQLLNLNLGLGLLNKCHLISLGINLGLPKENSSASNSDNENCTNIGLLDLALGLDLKQLLDLVLKGLLKSIIG